MNELLKRNLGYKLSAIFLAFLLWLYVNMAQNPLVEKIFSVDINYTGLTSDYILTQKPQKIDVKVKGQRAIVNNITSNDFRAEVNLTNAKIGEENYPVKIQVPPGVELLTGNSNRVSLSVDIITERQLPIFANIEGQVGLGYSNLGPIFSPSHIIVKGPKQILNTLQQAVVDVSLDNAIENIVLNLPVKIVNKSEKILTDGELQINPTTIEVTVPVVKNSPVKTVPIKVELSGKPKEGWQVSRLVIIPETVKITGDLKKLDEIEAIATQPIDINGIEGEKIVETELNVPEGITILYQSKIKLVIQVERSPVTKTFSELPLKIVNKNPMLNAIYAVKAVAITVQGSNEEIAKLSSEQIVTILDLTDLRDGVYSVPVQVDLPEAVQIIKITPNQVEVKLEAKKNNTSVDNKEEASL